jgi:hypothetical protein
MVGEVQNFDPEIESDSQVQRLVAAEAATHKSA